jgi:hypothetical protein
MEQSTRKKITLEVKTHQIEYGFKGGGTRTIYVEDTIDESTSTLIDGFKAWMSQVSEPGFIAVKENFYRRHSDIGFVELQASTVVRVVTLERTDNGPYQITNEE